MNTDKTSDHCTDIFLRQAAIIAGIGLLIMAILAPIANFSILHKLVVFGDAAKTVNNIIASEGLFRTCICCFLIVTILDIIVAWALYIFLRPVNRSLSVLTAWLRIVYATMLGVLLLNLIIVVNLIHGSTNLSVFETNQLQAQVMLYLNTFTSGWEFGLIIFGFHLLLLGYLLFKSRYVPKILGFLVIIAALGYLIDGIGRLFSPHYTISVTMVTFIGEVILIFWIFIKGVRIQEPY